VIFDRYIVISINHKHSPIKYKLIFELNKEMLTHVKKNFSNEIENKNFVKRECFPIRERYSFKVDEKLVKNNFATINVNIIFKS